MKTLDSYFVTEMTPDELFLINGGGLREIGNAIGKAVRIAAQAAEDSIEKLGDRIGTICSEIGEALSA